MKKTRGMLIFALMLVLSCGARAQSQQNSPPQNQSAKLGTNNGATQPNPSMIFPIPQEIMDAIAAAIDRADEKHDANHPPPPRDNSGWWFNFFLVSFTGLLVATGAGQCYLIFRTLKATEKSANAAQASAEAVVGQLRAYVSVVSAKIHGFDGEGPYRVQVRIGNTGQTPAFEMSGENGVTIREAEISRSKEELWPPERQHTEKRVPRSKSSQGPGVVSDSFITIQQISAEGKAAVRDGRSAIFAYGEILYRDAFSNDRITKYRLMYGGGAGANAEGL